jgi:hypothetical protein
MTDRSEYPSSTQEATTATTPTPDRAVGPRVVSATAIALAASLVIQNVVVAVTNAPSYADPIAQVLAYHAGNRVAVSIAVGLEAVNLSLILVFLTGLHGMLIRRRGAGTDWSRLALVAGATTAAILVLYAVLWIGVVLAAAQLSEPNLTLELPWRMHAAAFAFSLSALGTTFIGAALATHASRLTPRWQLVLGVVGGGLMIVTGPANLAIADGSGLVFVGVAGQAAWIVWLLATGLRLARPRVLAELS